MMRREGDWQPYCQRCEADLSTTAHTVSMFNTDVICTRCKDDEREAPGYANAILAENLAMGRGETNYAGLGLNPEDEAFLKARREARKAGGP